MTTWLGVGVDLAEVEDVLEDEDFAEVTDVTLLEDDLEIELVRLDGEEGFDVLEPETLDEDDDLEILVVLVAEGDFEVVEVDNGFVLVVKLEGEIVLLLDETDGDFEIVELNGLVDDLVEEELETLDDDFKVIEPDGVDGEDNCVLDFVPD